MNRNTWKDNEIYTKTKDKQVAKDHSEAFLIMNKRYRLTIESLEDFEEVD